MKIEQIKEIIGAKEIFRPQGFDTDITYVVVSDLMSDVLSYLNEMHDGHSGGILLITGLVGKQTIRTANLMDISAIVFTKGKIAPPEVIKAAEEEGLALLNTRMTSFLACGLLYKKGLKSMDDNMGEESDAESRLFQV